MSMICELLAIPDQSARQVMKTPARIHEILNTGDRSGRGLSLEKSWHGLHFTFTGSAWEGDEPLNFLVSGGESVGTEDVGYGPGRVLFADAVGDLDRALSALTDAEFRQRFDPAALQSADVYPQIWDEPLEDLLEEYGYYFRELKAFVRRAAQSGHAMVITIR